MDESNKFDMYSTGINEPSSTILMMDENTRVANDVSHLFMEPGNIENSNTLLHPSTFCDDLISFLEHDYDISGLMSPFNNGEMQTQIEKPFNFNQEENYTTPYTTPAPPLAPIPIPVPVPVPVPVPAPAPINRVMSDNMVTAATHSPIYRVMNANNMNTPMSVNIVTPPPPSPISRLISANIVTAPVPVPAPAPAPRRTARRGRPPLDYNPRNQDDQVGQNINVSQAISNKRPFSALATQSPNLLNYNPHHMDRYQELTRSVSSSIETSSHMNTGGGASVDQQRINNNSPHTRNQFDGRNEVSNRRLLPGSFQNTYDHTEEQKLQLMLRNLPSRAGAGAASQASSNSSIMSNTTSLNGHVGQNNLFGSNFSYGRGKKGSTFESGSGSTSNNLFDSSSASRANIVNQNNIFGSTKTLSNQAANTYGSVCINNNKHMPMFPGSHGSHYMQISSIYRDRLTITMGGSAAIEKFNDHPREINLMVGNGGEESNRGIGVSEGYNSEPVVHKELMRDDGVLSEGYNCKLLVHEEMPNKNVAEPPPSSDESDFFKGPSFWIDEDLNFNSFFKDY